MLRQRYGRWPVAALIATGATITSFGLVSAQPSDDPDAAVEPPANDVDGAIGEALEDADAGLADSDIGDAYVAKHSDSAANADRGVPESTDAAEAAQDVSQPDATLDATKQELQQRYETEPETQTTATPPTLIEEEPIEPGYNAGINVRVIDSESGKGLQDAVVIAKSKKKTAYGITDPSGNYQLSVPEGLYSVRAFQDAYYGGQIDRVRVKRARITDITLKLEPISGAQYGIVEIVIPYRADVTSAAAQDELRQESSGIGEGMGAKQMSQEGASDASAAAARVVGVTVEGNQLVVRGLGGRYSRVLLNGVTVPSTDPDVPGADLDLFPTGVIDSMIVAKAFLPNMPADFAGGVLMINTVSFPRDFTLEIGTSVGANTQSTFREKLIYPGGDLDWLGFDDGRRDIPQALPDDRLQVSRNGRYQSFEELEEAAELFDNTWQYKRITSLPKMGMDLTVGDSVNLGKRRRFGYLTSIAYDYNSKRKTGISRPRPRIAEDGSLEVFNDYRVESGSDEVQLAALGTASLDLGPEDSLTFLTLFNRSLTDETTLKTGESGELAAGESVEKWQLQFLSRTLSLNQLLGDHQNLFASKLRLRWNGFFSLGRRDEPDRRSVIYGPQGGQFRWLEKANSGERFFSELEQIDFGGGANLRFPLWPEGWGTVGALTQTSGREFINRRFRMVQDPSNTDQSVYQDPVEELFSEEGIGTITRIREFTRSDDSYTSRQNLGAGFAMIESPVVGPLSMAGGLRTEIAYQNLESRSPFEEKQTEDDEENRVERTDVDFLPGVALKYALAEHMFLRTAYGMTLGRPQIRELAPYQYYDFLRDRNVQGNPDLESTAIHNLDLRWEWFFDKAEVIAITLFGKQFFHPIELQILNPDNYDAQFINAQSARNIGSEFELRLGLRKIHPVLDNFSFGSNFALIWSRVELPQELSGAVKSERRLFGQSPYVINLSLSHNEPKTDTTLTLVYNVVGPRISDVGTRVGEFVFPDIEEQPFHALDLVGSWEVSEHFKLKLKVKNILFRKREFRQGDFLVQRVDPGVSCSVGMSYSE